MNVLLKDLLTFKKLTMKKKEIRDQMRSIVIKSLKDAYSNENAQYECKVVIISSQCCYLFAFFYNIYPDKYPNQRRNKI